MISGADIRKSLTAAWQLFLDRRGAIQMFDTSIDGFWKSFQAIILVAPIYAVTVVADEQAYEALLPTSVPFDAATFYVARALTLLLEWVTVPILLALLAPALGIRSGYTAYIVARNWGMVVTSVPFAILSLLDLSGLFPGQAILFPAGVALAIALRISYLAARRALAVPIDMAIGFVALDLLVSVGLTRGITYVLGVPGVAA
jgi:hypothetical protein